MEIKKLKEKSKKILKNNFGTLAIVCIFMSFFIGEYIISNDGFRNLAIIGQVVQDKREDRLITSFFEQNSGNIINEYVDKAIYNLISGNTAEKINKYNYEHNVSKGLFFTAFNFITNGQIQFQNVVSAISNYSSVLSKENLQVIIGAIIAFVIKILILNPFIVGENRLFLENINYKKTKFRRLTYPFKKGNYLSVVKAILLMRVYQFLWDLTIIGGIIKNYSYKMVAFIVAENPKLSAKDAINLSKQMMNGHKFEAFKIDLSFFGWFVLEYISFGLAGIFVNPYYKACFTEFYIELRNEYKASKKPNYELLNDEILYNKEKIKEKYPEIYELTRGNIQNYPENNIKPKKEHAEYQTDYSIWSLILMFFIFSFVGWIWECIYILVEQGILVNRGAMYGPWLPIYGFGCTLILITTKLKLSRKLLARPFKTFLTVMVLCTILEYFTSWILELYKGVRYWDYTGIFLNINGRVCLENSLFFGIGGCIALYFVGPYLEEKISKISHKIKIGLSIFLISVIVIDTIYSTINVHIGPGITNRENAHTVSQNKVDLLTKKQIKYKIS